ncbi:MAG: glutaredoxin 3 [Bacillota bacterium]|nr:glutaredoxin 3 [Bacillota bacterium]
MKEVTLYTTKFCPYCIKALRMLSKKEVSYKNIDVNKNQELYKKIKKQTGSNTVPQIFIEEEFIGGYDEMNQLDKEGKLDSMLGI